MFSLAKLRICWIFLGAAVFFQGFAFGSLAPGVYNGAPARFVLGTETLRIWRRFGITRRRFGSKAVKTVVTTYLQLAAAELKKNGKFKLGGSLNMKLKKKPATKARKGANPFTKEPCVFNAKPASKTVRVLPTKKFKEMVN